MSETGSDGSDGPREKVSLKDAADHVFSTVTFDVTKHWTIDRIAAEAEQRDLVPDEVRSRALRRAVKDWLTTFQRYIKVKVEVGETSFRVRKFGVYIHKMRVPDGVVEEQCYREWAVMGRKEGKSALRELDKIVQKADREKMKTLKYFNSVLEGRGERPLTLGEIRWRRGDGDEE
jgi:hypothetical protein